jgi:YVTN family beta-propeller protein
MKGFVLGGSLLALCFLAACNSDQSTVATCPTGSAPGPALAAPGSYLLVAHSLGETWTAIDLAADTLRAASVSGLTGQAPNDLEVVGNTLYVVNSGENSISTIDLTTGRTDGCISIGANTNPWELEIDPSDSTRAWLTTYLSGEIVEMDLTTRHVLRRRAVSPTLEGLWVSATTIAVTQTSFDAGTFTYGTGYVILLRKSDLGEIARFPVPMNPQFVFQGGDGRLQVVCSGDYGANPGRIVRMESDLSAVRDTLTVGGAPGRAILAPGGVAYLTAFCDGLLSYDTVAFVALHDATHALLPGVCAGDVALDAERIFVADFNHDAVQVLRRSNGAVLGEVPVGDGPSALVVWSH